MELVLRKVTEMTKGLDHLAYGERLQSWNGSALRGDGLGHLVSIYKYLTWRKYRRQRLILSGVQ